MSELIIDQGATWKRRWLWVDPTAAPVDMTGLVATLQARYGGPDGAIALELDSASKGGIVVTGAEGYLDATVAATATSALVLSQRTQGTSAEKQSDGTTRRASGTFCVWALELASVDGTVTRLDEGTLVITREVVR